MILVKPPVDLPFASPPSTGRDLGRNAVFEAVYMTPATQQRALQESLLATRPRGFPIALAHAEDIQHEIFQQEQQRAEIASSRDSMDIDGDGPQK